MASDEQLPFRIQVLRRLNPLISCLLKSPVHGLASKRLLVLHYLGRKTGKPYTIPLVYVTHGGQTYCVTRNTQWWKNAIHASSVTIWLRGMRLNARAEHVPSTTADSRAAFAKFLAENPGTATLVYGVRIDAQGKPEVSDLDREVHNSKIVLLTPLDQASAAP